MAKAKITFQDVEKARRAFATELREFRKQKGLFHNPAPELPDSVMQGSTIVASRQALLSRLPKSAAVAKIGVEEDQSAWELFERADPATLHLVMSDASKVQTPGLRAALAAPEGRVRVHLGPIAEGIAKLRDASLDIAWLDNDQSYEGTLRDLQAITPKIRPGGSILMSNYTIWSVGSMYHCGVGRAVHEFCLEGGWRFSQLALHPMMYYDLLLTQDAA